MVDNFWASMIIEFPRWYLIYVYLSSHLFGMNSRYYKIFGPLNCDHIAKSPLDAINQFKFVDKI